MGSLSPIHWIIIAVVVLLIFGGRGKLSSIMGDAARGVRAFREGLKGDDEKSHADPAQQSGQPLPPPVQEKDPVVR